MAKKVSFITLMLLGAVALNAQFSINSELRTKFEYRDGFKTLLTDEQNPAFVTSQRTRLNLNYSNEKINSCISVQDVRIWGDEVYKKDNSTIHVHEAWGEVLFNNELSLKIGRQKLSYDKNRLLGTRNWNDVGASHDLALLKFAKNDLKIHLGTAYNNNKSKNYENNYDLNYYKTMSFIWLSKKLSETFQISLIGITDGYQKENSDNTIYFRGTYGANVDYTPPKLKLYGQVYHQVGKNIDGENRNAFFFSLKADYSVTEKINSIFAIDYFSGDDGLKNDNTSTSFSKLYGNGHGYYGYMDYFTDVEKHSKSGGLMDIYARLKLKHGSAFSSELTYHNFSLTNNFIDSEDDTASPKAIDKYIGSEIDYVLTKKYTKAISFKFGYSVMLATESMEALKTGDKNNFSHWAWLMVSLKPELFNSN